MGQSLVAGVVGAMFAAGGFVALAVLAATNEIDAGGLALAGVLILVLGWVGGGYFARQIFNKTRSYDPVHADYDDRPPTDPA